jgi:hypothetical protein
MLIQILQSKGHRFTNQKAYFHNPRSPSSILESSVELCCVNTSTPRKVLGTKIHTRIPANRPCA